MFKPLDIPQLIPNQLGVQPNNLSCMSIIVFVPNTNALVLATTTTADSAIVPFTRKLDYLTALAAEVFKINFETIKLINKQSNMIELLGVPNYPKTDCTAIARIPYWDQSTGFFLL